MMTLFYLGEREKEIRELLGYTQSEMADILGISAPVLLNIEKDPGRMNKLIAISLVSNVFSILDAREIILKDMDFNLWANERTKILSLLSGLRFTEKVAYKVRGQLYENKANSDNNLLKDCADILKNKYLIQDLKRISDFRKRPNIFMHPEGWLSEESELAEKSNIERVKDIIETRLFKLLKIKIYHIFCRLLNYEADPIDNLKYGSSQIDDYLEAIAEKINIYEVVKFIHRASRK